MPRKIDYEAKYKAMSAYEDMLRESGVQWIAGIDEAGRGPLAGPVVAAAVILDPKQPVYGVDDSKKLSPKRRAARNWKLNKKRLRLAWALLT